MGRVTLSPPRTVSEMGDDLVARLRGERTVWVNGDARVIVDPFTVFRDMAEAADRIEALEAERDTLAEIVRLFDPWVTLRVAGHGPYLANRRPAPGEHITLTPEQAERFQTVLDRTTKETSDGE